MRVSVVIPSFYPAVVYGGWVFSSINTCRELAKLGITSFVSTTNDNGKETITPAEKKFVFLEENIFVKYYRQLVRERFSLSMLLNLRKDIRQCDLVHIQAIFSAPTPLGLFYASLCKKKVLLSPHGCLGSWCLGDGSKFKKIYLLFFIKPYANKILWHATSAQEAGEIKALYPKAKVVIIPNGISVNEFDFVNSYSRSEFIKKFTGHDIAASKVIISMARLHKKKALDVLIESFKKSLTLLPENLLLIAGEDFGEKANLQKLITEFGLADKVYFVGHISGQDRMDFFANADLFVLPSHNENFGMVFAEAMAAGTPVVASTGTPWQEVESLGIGRWVRNDPDATAAAIVDILTRDHKKMGSEAREFVRDKYSWENIGKKFQHVFRGMIGEDKTRTSK